MSEVGVGYVSIVPKFDSGLKKAIADHFGDAVQEMEKATQKSFSQKLIGGLESTGGKISKVGGALSKYITTPAVAAGGAVATLVTALGFKRLVGIDTARSQFKGLGLDADAVMQQVDKGVTDTSLSMAEGASLAVGILATGNVPLEGLESQIKRVANVSAAYNVESQHAGYLLNNILTKNKVTWGDLSQMQQNNIPIVTALAEHYGVSGDAIMDMAKKGQISVEDLNTVLDNKAGAAAEEYAKSWQGVTKNILSNIGKIGAKLMEPTFDNVKAQLADFLQMLRSPEFSQWASDMGQKISEFVSKAIDGIMRLIGWWNGLSDSTKGFIVKLGLIAVAAGPVLKVVGGLVTGIAGVVKVVGTISKVVSAFRALGIVAKVGAAGMKLLNLVMLAGPWGWIALAIAALVGAFIYLWNHSEAFRNFFIGLWEGIKQVASAVADWFAGPFLDFFTNAWEGIKAGASAVGDFFVGLWEGIKAGVAAVGEFFVGIWDGAVAGVTALWDGLTAAWNMVSDAVTAPLQFWIEMISATWETIKTVIATAFLVIHGLFTGNMDQVREALSAGWEKLKAIWSGAFERIKAIGGAAWDTIKNVFAAAWNSIVDFVRGGWEKIKNFFLNAGMAIAARAVDAWNRVKSAFISGVSAAVAFAQQLPGKLLSALASLAATLTGLATRAWQGFKTATMSGISAAISFISSLPSRILSALAGAGNWLVSVGRQVLEGFINGAKAMAGRIKDAVLAPIRGAVDAAKGFLGIRSPSRLMIQMATDTWAGFTQGTERKLGSVESAAEDVARAAVPNFRAVEPLGVSLAGQGTTGAAQALAGAGVTVTGPLVQVDSMTVRSDADIKRISQELQRLIDAKLRSVGRGFGMAGGVA